jgi:hypothetical protein
MIRAVPLLLIAVALPASAQTDKPEANHEIPIGLEAVTGFRSESIWRGFKLGDGYAIPEAWDPSRTGVKY